jgi:hypothetical protein
MRVAPKKRRFARLPGCFSWFCAVLVVMPAIAEPEPQRASPPDLTGLWMRPYSTSLKTYDHADKVLFPPPPPAPDYTPEYARKTKENEEAYNAANTPKGAGPYYAKRPVVLRQVTCLPHGMPRTMEGMASIDIIQKPDRITMIGEFEREIRRVWLDRPMPPREEIDPGWWGFSVGKWEGDSLVVTTTGIRDDLEGMHFMAHSAQMVITERIRLARPDVLTNEMTITDPLALKTPWTIHLALVRLPKSTTPGEYVCENLRAHLTKNGSIVREK